MTFTFGPSTSTSYISPRSTMSIPSSGSSTWRRASTTSARVALMRSMYPRCDFQPQDVRAVEVPGRIEPLQRFAKVRRLQFRVEDRLLAVDRPREVGAVGCEYRASSAAEHVDPLDQLAQREVLGVGGRPLEVARSDDERA